METTRSSGARLCQLWLHCAAVGRWKGHLRPHFDKVWVNKQIAHCVPPEPTMSLSCTLILIGLPQAQGASVQCGILSLRKVPCQRQLWQVRILFHRPTYTSLHIYFPSGVSTSGALRVASWFTLTGALAASLRCWGLRLNLRCRNFLYITGVLEQQRWQGGSKCERRNCLCSGPEKVKVISPQCWL